MSNIFGVKFRRGSETILAKKDFVLKKNEIVITLPEEHPLCDEENLSYYEQKIFKYKIGDGIHRWSELDYEPGLLPVVLYLTGLLT